MMMRPILFTTSFSQTGRAKAFAMLVALSLVFVLGTVSFARAFEIKEVTSPKGIKAWLVEDYTVPIISLSFSLRGGTTQDPQGKEGAMRYLVSMMDEGAGDLDSKAFRQKTEDLGLELGFSVNDDNFTGGVRMLKAEEDASFKLFATTVNETRFDDEALERMRAALKENVVRGRFSPDVMMGAALRESVYGDQPYGRDDNGTEQSLDSISKQDLMDLKNKVFARDKLVIGVVGAISPEDLGKRLDEVFGSWADKSGIVEFSDAKMTFGDEKRVKLNSPQDTVQIMLPGVKRDSKDFFAAHLMVHVLGGGTFSSRLFEEIREKRGLVYSIGAGMSAKDHAAYTSIGFSTKADQSEQAVALVLDEVRKMAAEGPTAEELELAKKNVYGSYAISNFGNSGSIASVLVTLQDEKLGKDYIEKRGELINSVTLEDVKRVAKQLLGQKPTVVVVGPEPARGG